MILNTILDHNLVKRKILMFEQAYIERNTGLLFIPLVEEVWLNTKTGKFIRVLANNQHRYNAKSPYFVNNFRKVVASWYTLFCADPKTMVIEDGWELAWLLSDDDD